MKTKISKARTKIFNERKTARLRTSKTLAELESVAMNNLEMNMTCEYAYE